jgi:hypothetical protein
MSHNPKTHFLKKLRGGPTISVDKRILKWSKSVFSKQLSAEIKQKRLEKKLAKNKSIPTVYRDLFGEE